MPELLEMAPRKRKEFFSQAEIHIDLCFVPKHLAHAIERCITRHDIMGSDHYAVEVALRFDASKATKRVLSVGVSLPPITDEIQTSNNRTMAH